MTCHNIQLVLKGKLDFTDVGVIYLEMKHVIIDLVSGDVIVGFTHKSNPTISPSLVSE